MRNCCQLWAGGSRRHPHRHTDTQPHTHMAAVHAENRGRKGAKSERTQAAR